MICTAPITCSLSPPRFLPPSLSLQVLCWGVRDMKRFQLLPVTSPLVEVECGGTVVRSEHIKDAKKNPNFPKPVVSFEVVGLATCTCAVFSWWVWLVNNVHMIFRNKGGVGVTYIYKYSIVQYFSLIIQTVSSTCLKRSCTVHPSTSRFLTRGRLVACRWLGHTLSNPSKTSS